MEDSVMIRRSCSGQPTIMSYLPTLVVASLLVVPLLRPAAAAAQGAAQTGSIGGRVVDQDGAPVGGAQIFVRRATVATQSGSNGEYVLDRVPVGTQSLQVRMLGF